MYEIRNQFINSKGIIYDNIRNVHFKSKADICGGIGTFITNSNAIIDDPRFFKEEEVYIYRSLYNPNIGLRIYNDYGAYQYTTHGDEKIVSKLQKRQKNIKLTEFPTGVITIEDKVIGQEIPFYNNTKTLIDYLETNKQKNIKLYLEVLKILRELCENGIIYKDIHARNFLVNNVTECVNLIDFESGFISFQDKNCLKNEDILMKLKFMINKLNEMCGISFSDKFDNVESLDEMEEYIKEFESKKVLTK